MDVVTSLEPIYSCCFRIIQDMLIPFTFYQDLTESAEIVWYYQFSKGQDVDLGKLLTQCMERIELSKYSFELFICFFHIDVQEMFYPL